jgi:hypothetical protein
VLGFAGQPGHARFYVGITLGVSLLTMLFNAAAFWTPAHLMRVHKFTAADVAASYGPLMMIFGAAGVLAGGALADRWRRLGRTDAELRVGVVSALALWPVAIWTFRSTDSRTMLWLLGPMLFLSSFPFAATSAAIQLATPNEYRARISAMYLLVLNLTGIGFGSTAAALVSDYWLHDERRIGDGVAVVAAVAAPLAALAFLWARKGFSAMQAPGIAAAQPLAANQSGRTGT